MLSCYTENGTEPSFFCTAMNVTSNATSAPAKLPTATQSGTQVST